MPKLRWSDVDWDDLPDEWEESEFEPYDGDQPPSGTLLNGEIDRMWYKTFSSGNVGFVVSFKAKGNRGDKEEYDGWSCLDNIVLQSNTAFRYGPLLEVLGITLDDVRRRTVTEEDEDQIGLPIVKIGTTKLPVACSIITKIEKYEGERRAKVKTYSELSKRAKASGSKASSRRRAAMAGEEDDDDLPF
jgi:hypothetical protein